MFCRVTADRDEWMENLELSRQANVKDMSSQKKSKQIIY